MGNELGEYLEWRDEKELGWNLLTYPIHDSLHEYVKALHKLYLEQPALYKSDYNSTKLQHPAAAGAVPAALRTRRLSPAVPAEYAKSVSASRAAKKENAARVAHPHHRHVRPRRRLRHRLW